MGFSISPVDGFITRLLQQTHQSAAKAPAAAQPQAQKPDQVSISSEARQAGQVAGNDALESRLMDLYNRKGV